MGPRITSSQLMESCAQSVAVGRINLVLSAKRFDFQLFFCFFCSSCVFLSCAFMYDEIQILLPTGPLLQWEVSEGSLESGTQVEL